MKLYIAVVESDGGTDCYVNLDYEKLRKELADECRSLWKMQNLPGDPPEDDEETIDLYYGEVQDEYLHTFEKEIEVDLGARAISR